MFRGIDLYSDTVTLPTDAMRQAMVNAEVGDEQRQEDPTTRQLEQYVAELLGKDTALFFPSATMANEVAIQLNCPRGTELIAYENCHLFRAECGGPAIHAGVQARPISSTTGIFSGADILAKFTPATAPHFPLTSMVSVENTTNLAGGIAWSLEELADVVETSKNLGLKLHLDGARLFNAVTQTSLTPKTLASRFDTITLCLSKGLGCPIGAVLAFDSSQHEIARRLKHQMGGALRQSGILAAAGIYALENHIGRLAEDHETARLLRDGIEGISGFEVEKHPRATNMAFFNIPEGKVNAENFHLATQERGVRFSPMGGRRFRAVTHLGIEKQHITQTLEIIRQVGSLS